jgi:hypothetical protein
MEVYRMEEGRGPVFRVQGRSVQQGAQSSGPRLIPAFGAAVLGRAIRASWLDLVTMSFLHLGDELLAFSELTTLVTPEYTAGCQAKDFEVRGHFVDGRILRDTQEYPAVARVFVDDRQVAVEAIVRLDYAIFAVIFPTKVFRRRTNESKINKETLAATGDSLSLTAGRLPTNTSLLLMIDVPEGMIIELSGEAVGAGRDDV